MSRRILSDFMAPPANSPDLIYVNVGIINANDDTNTLTSMIKPANFVEMRSVAILDDAVGWEYSIVRFNMDGCGALLPLWIPQIAIGPNPNQTVYELSICKTGSPPKPMVPLQFVTAYPSLPTPAAPLVQQDSTNLYYYGKSYMERALPSRRTTTPQHRACGRQ